MDSLPKMCDYLGLHLLVLNSDNRYHFKLYDLQNRSAMKYLSKDGKVLDIDLFIRWWLCSASELESFHQ